MLKIFQRAKLFSAEVKTAVWFDEAAQSAELFTLKKSEFKIQCKTVKNLTTPIRTYRVGFKK